MADDQTNPYTQIGMLQMLQPNPYTQYKGQLPMPGYMGTPTDALGNPIKSFTDAQAQHDAWAGANLAPAATGTTLNSTPALGDQARSDYAAQKTGYNAMSGMMSPQGANTYANQLQGPSVAGQSSAGQAAPAAAATATNPVDMRQAYLTALSNPGKVTTPGATVPQAQPLGQPSVMNAFLAANPSGGGAGAGNYNNSGFFNTLNKLRSA